MRRDHPNPYFPFFHLKGALRGGGASFWHLEHISAKLGVETRTAAAAVAMVRVKELAWS